MDVYRATEWKANPGQKVDCNDNCINTMLEFDHRTFVFDRDTEINFHTGVEHFEHQQHY